MHSGYLAETQECEKQRLLAETQECEKQRLLAARQRHR
jgi:hypothetical protein